MFGINETKQQRMVKDFDAQAREQCELVEDTFDNVLDLYEEMMRDQKTPEKKKEPQLA